MMMRSPPWAFGVLEVLMDRGSAEPDDEKVRTVEGWILGQKAQTYG